MKKANFQQEINDIIHVVEHSKNTISNLISEIKTNHNILENLPLLWIKKLIKLGSMVGNQFPFTLFLHINIRSASTIFKGFTVKFPVFSKIVMTNSCIPVKNYSGILQFPVSDLQ